VKESEAQQGDWSFFANEEKLTAYQACWFELEILNALALDEWETDGKPGVWLVSWNRRYEKNARALVEKLCSLLS
jgi:hypothetical protein